MNDEESEDKVLDDVAIKYQPAIVVNQMSLSKSIPAGLPIGCKLLQISQWRHTDYCCPNDRYL